MKALSRFQYTCLARLIAGELSGATMKVDCRSIDALGRRALVRYSGEVARRGMENKLTNIQPWSEKTVSVTDEGWALYGDDRKLSDEVAMHLRVESKRALDRASSYETTARLLRRRAAQWDEALTQ